MISRKNSSIVLFLLTIISYSISAEQGRLIVIPQDIYVGDEAEIRYTFHAEQGRLEEEITFDENSLLFADSEEEFTLVNGILSVAGVEYTLILRIIPWKPGTLTIPPLTVEGITIKIPPITVKSVIKLTGIQTLRPPAPPLIIPGTTYLIYGISATAVILIALLILFLLKGKRFVTSIRASFFSYRRLKHFMKDMRRLSRKNSTLNDRDYYSELTRIIRIYLDKRFMPIFSTATTAELESKLRIFAGEGNLLIRSLCDICLRTDYIRFSPEGIGGNSEREKTVDRLKQLIPLFEKENAESDTARDIEEGRRD